MDMDRLYATRGEGEKGWMSVKNAVKVEERSLSEYLKRAEGHSECRMPLE